mmetsp:Transcript_21112/g.33980  ORF Transcript_21112/g.33980 Transcript_21112/m.33980 type:complete len:122 (-) Transcript_21112:1138-1503(-)
MGNCGSANAVETGAGNSAGSNKKKPTKAFQGTGRRLGAANEQVETPVTTTGLTPARKDDDLPTPTRDPNVSNDERERQRQARLAAAEARQKKHGGSPKKEKKSTAPLRGPNSEPLMRWQAG